MSSTRTEPYISSALEQPALNRNRLCGSDLRRDDIAGLAVPAQRLSSTLTAARLPAKAAIGDRLDGIWQSRRGSVPGFVGTI